VKFLFFSPHALADSSSGAALSVANLLAELVRQGHTCAAITGSLLDADNELFAQVLKTEAQHHFSINEFGLKVPVRKLSIDGVLHLIAGFKSSRAMDFTAAEETLLYGVFLEAFRDIDPDAVISYGGFSSNYAAGSYAMSRGRTSVLNAASVNYAQPDQFLYANKILTVSCALADRLRTVTQLPIANIPPLINRAAIQCETRTPEYITFSNPTLAKGLKLAAALAMEAARNNRPYKFLFVEGRGTRDTIQTHAPEVLQLPTVHVAKNTAAMRLIYERSKIMLFPSLCFEAAGMIPIEANINGIPVLASNRGGVAEMMDGAGYLFDPPPACLADYAAPPPADYVAKWLEALDRLHDGPAEMADAERRARAAGARYDVAEMAKKFAAFAQP
jgi:glycosyltransferase involved in cell wall biosynthesis